ncbi:Sensor protein ZraS [bacterium HR33]|nr:Sensor protein ZraS [bacterium HR33]
MKWVSTSSDRATLRESRVSRIPAARDLLQWVYVGRVLVAVVVFVAAAFYFRAQPPEVIVTLATAAIASVVASSASFLYTHLKRGPLGPTFFYIQALFDLALVTTIVHVTGGIEDFSALYILVIAVTSLLMPVASSLLLTLLACILYVADIVWFQPVDLSVAVWLQLGIFVAVAIATSWLASRVRVVGAAHEQLRREVTRLRLEAGDILRNIRSGILSVDGEGNLAYANPAAEELLGIRAVSLIGKPVGELLRKRAPQLWAAIEATRSGGRRVLRAEGEIVQDSRSFPIGLTATAVGLEQGEQRSVTAIFTDISDQKRLEELRRRTERLEAVAELSASLAHEIRNPLASIRSSVEQLAKSAKAGEDEAVLAGLILRESDRLSRLLEEFLDFSRVRVMARREFDLLAAAAAAAELVRNHPHCGEDVEIAVKGSPTVIEGDEDLLHRVVANLALNAVQAAGRGAKVEIEVRAAGEDELPAGVNLEEPVLLKVRDNGPGISPEIRDRLFQPFVSGRPGGSGLGLAIVQRAVQAHGGVVLVDSAQGGGACFRIFLPRRLKTETDQR